MEYCRVCFGAGGAIGSGYEKDGEPCHGGPYVEIPPCTVCGGSGDRINLTLGKGGPCHAGPYTESATYPPPGKKYCPGCGHEMIGVNCPCGA